ncbi:MAG TPA: hypothetical protein ENO03_08405 [Candidatus Aminicenantes bacterium]|nr:hypothetical protein [Candidatus Aminicenantes bacterium]
MVLVLTGPLHGGKTTFLERRLPAWAERGLVCRGFLSPAVTDRTGLRGYDLVEIGSGRRRPYLRREGEAGAESVGPYVFVPSTLDRARSIIRAADPSAVLVVDEVGPLEVQGGGLWPDLRSALDRPGLTALLVAREGIIPDLAAALSPREPVVFDLRDEKLIERLDTELFTGPGPHDDRG